MSRVECPRCLRPENYCYCADLPCETASVDLIILQHPKESKHPMNTARIAELGLSNCQIIVGEDFSEHARLQEILHTRRCFLLFPRPDAIDSQVQIQQVVPEVVIILDGTWKKARRIYHCNPGLQQLPALSISHDQLSNYRIRKTPNELALSTVEAAVILLRYADKNDTSHQSLLDAFDRMIQMQIEAMGQGVYQKNYTHRIRQ